MFCSLFFSSLFPDGMQSLQPKVTHLKRLSVDDLPAQPNNISLPSKAPKQFGNVSHLLEVSVGNKVSLSTGKLSTHRNSSSSSDWFDSSPVDNYNSPDSQHSLNSFKPQGDNTNKNFRSANAGIITNEHPANQSTRIDTSWRRDDKGSVRPESSRETLSDESLISCRGRCGDRKKFACSCADICIVNGDCCTDIETECPDLVVSAHIRYRHLSHSDVTCSSKTQSFMVISCPEKSTVGDGQIDGDLLSSREMVTTGELDSTDTFSSRSTTANTLATQKNLFSTDAVTWPSHNLKTTLAGTEKSEEIRSFNNAFLSLVLDTPVTDLVTGLVYRNRSVASCNSVLDVNMLFWKLQVPLVSFTLKPKNLEEVNEIVNTRSSAYNPPDISGSTSAGSLCVYKSIRRCKAEYLADQPELESLCLNGNTVYYRNNDRNIKSIYSNIYCVLCFRGSDEYVTPLRDFEYTGKNYRFSILASISNGGTVRISALDKASLVPWSELECSLSSGKQDHEQCFKDECNENFEKRPDGACRQARKAKFAVGAYDCPFMRSQYLMEKMVALINCHLKTTENSELNENNNRFDIIYDKRLNLTLVELSGEVYYPYVKKVRNGRRFLRELAMLLYDANFCCGPSPPVAMCSSNSCHLGEHEVPAITSLDVEESNDHDFSSGDVGAKIDPISESTMIFCETKWSMTEGEYTSTVCHEEPVYTSQLGFFHRTANLSCYGNGVGEHSLHMRAHRACSESPSVISSARLVYILLPLLYFSAIEDLMCFYI